MLADVVSYADLSGSLGLLRVFVIFGLNVTDVMLL